MKYENVLTLIIDFSSDGEQRVLAAAIQLGMEEEEAKEWLKEWLLMPAPSLNFVAPYTLLNTEEGIEQVINRVSAISYGVYL